MILVLFIGGGLALFALRAPLLKQGGLFAPVSREGALVLNNLFLVSACATVFVGTLYPLALEALTGDKISVGAPFFNMTFGPLFIPLLIAVPFGPLLAWKRGDLLGVAQRLIGAAAIAAIAVAVIFAMEGGGGPILVPFAVGLALFVMAGAVTEIVERTGLLKVPFSTAFARAWGLPRSAWGGALAHFGLGVTLLGIIGETQWGIERIAELKPGQTITIRRYELHFDGMANRQGPNYRELAAQFTVRRLGEVIGVMEPAKRIFPSREHRHHRERAADAGLRAALPLPRRCQSRRIDRGAALLQAAGDAHLARRRCHGDRRCAVALGSPFARGRAEAGQGKPRHG